jgi:hypothetical protein
MTAAAVQMDRMINVWHQMQLEVFHLLNRPIEETVQGDSILNALYIWILYQFWYIECTVYVVDSVSEPLRYWVMQSEKYTFFMFHKYM